MARWNPDAVAKAIRNVLEMERRSGEQRTLAHYERLFPGFEDVVAREFAAAAAQEGPAAPAAGGQPAGAPSGAAAPPGGDPPRASQGAAAPERSAAEGAKSDEQLIGPYRILRELGRGGQATVYLAEDTRLPRRVALKVLTGAHALSDSMLTRFRREADAASRLDHPGICTVYEADVDGRTPFIAMRHVEGQSLAHWLQETRSEQTAAKTGGRHRTSGVHLPSSSAGEAPTPVRAGDVRPIVALFERIARALHAAHEAGLIHRDVKPANVMVTTTGEPVVLDFGLAREEDGDTAGLTMTGSLLGTPAYMSPEQLMAQRIRLDRRTDVYSLGVTLYECLTLRLPFDAPTREGLYHAILTTDAADARRVNPAIPRDLAVVVATAIEKNRERRYQTALAFAEDLRRIRMSEPILARPAGPLLRMGRWFQRNPALAGLFVVLALGLVVSTALLVRVIAEEAAKEVALGYAVDARKRAEGEERKALESAAETKKALERLTQEQARTRDALEDARAAALVGASVQAESADRVLSLLLADAAVAAQAGREPSPESVARLHAVRTSMPPPILLGEGEDGFTSADWLPPGDRIVTVSDGDLVRVFDVAGREVARRNVGVNVGALSVIPSGDRIALWSGDSCRIVDRDLRPVATVACGLVWRGELSPRGDMLFVSGSQGTRLVTLDGRFLPLEGWSAAWAARVEFSLDGSRTLASAWDGRPSVYGLDGRRIAAFGDDAPGTRAQWIRAKHADRILKFGGGTVTLWDFDGRRVASVSATPGGPQSVAVSPRGDLFVAVVQTGVGTVWDEDGKEVARFVVPAAVGAVTRVAFAGTAPRLLLQGSAGAAVLLDLRGNVVAELRGGAEDDQSRALDPERGHFFRTDRSAVRVYDEQLRLVARLPVTPAGWVRNVSASRDETRVLVLGGGEVAVWDLAATEPVLVRDADGPVVPTLSPRGDSFLVRGRSRTARLVDMKGRVLADLTHDAPVSTAAFSPKGDRLVTVAGDGTATLWDGSGRRVAPVGPPDVRVLSAGFAAAGDRLLLTLLDGTVDVRDTDGRPLCVLRGHDEAVAQWDVARGGDRIVTRASDSTIRLWDLGGRELARFIVADNGEARFTPDGNRLLVNAGFVTPWLCDRDGVVVSTFPPAEDAVVHAKLLREGAVTMADGRGIRVWDAAGRVLGGTALGASEDVVVSPDGARFAIHGDPTGTVRLWGAHGLETATLVGHAAPVRAVVFSTSGDSVLTASDDGTARLWDVSGKQLAVFAARGGAVRDAAFSPAGDRVLTLDASGVRIWDREGTLRAALRDPAARVEGAQFTADGAHVVTWGGAGVAVWAADPQELAKAAWGRRLRPFRRSEREAYAKLLGDASRLEVAAERRVQTLVDDLLISADVVARIETDPSQSDDDRRRALDVARRLVDDADRLTEAASRIVRTPGAGPAAVDRALRLAEAAVRRMPAARVPVLVLGAAQFRHGDFETAVKTLRPVADQSSEQGEPHPAGKLFLAMALHQAGNPGEARTVLADVRDPEKWGWQSRRDGTDTLLAEAESMIGAAKAPGGTK